jgi:hypothetical protein
MNLYRKRAKKGHIQQVNFSDQGQQVFTVSAHLPVFAPGADCFFCGVHLSSISFQFSFPHNDKSSHILGMSVPHDSWRA